MFFSKRTFELPKYHREEKKNKKLCSNDNLVREIVYSSVFPELGLVLCSWARVSETGSWMCICSQGRPLHLTTNAAMGLRELLDALFSFETRYSSEVLCLQAAAQSPGLIFLLHNPVLLIRVFIVPHLSTNFGYSEGPCPSLLLTKSLYSALFYSSSYCPPSRSPI